jgi:transcriptional regulator with XRE-family HTH domain
MSKELASKLKLVRSKLDLTQQELADKLPVPLPTLIKWENDLRTPRGFALKALEEKLQALLQSGSASQGPPAKTPPKPKTARKPKGS